MKQVRDVLQLHSVMKLSIRKIQGATNVDKSTIPDPAYTLQYIGEI